MRRFVLLLTALFSIPLTTWWGRPPAVSVASAAEGRTPMVRVRVIGHDGKLTQPVETPKLVLTDAQWKKRLTPDQYKIARAKGTEPAFCGLLLHNKVSGIYACVCCNLPLFKSATKFESGTGWPSFNQPVAEENIREHVDHSHGTVRTEILCTRCDAHLGHVFDDGPPPTGRRYCLNSEVPALRFRREAEDVGRRKVPAARLRLSASKVGDAMLPLSRMPNSFWRVGASGASKLSSSQLDGVLSVVKWLRGRQQRKRPTIKTVSTGTTNHAEVRENRL